LLAIYSQKAKLKIKGDKIKFFRTRIWPKFRENYQLAIRCNSAFFFGWLYSQKEQLKILSGKIKCFFRLILKNLRKNTK
jgi:hypothetical protein